VSLPRASVTVPPVSFYRYRYRYRTVPVKRHRGSRDTHCTGTGCVLVNLDGCEVVCVIRVPLSLVRPRVPCVPVCVSRVCPGSPGVSFYRYGSPVSFCLELARTTYVPLRKHSRGPLPPLTVSSHVSVSVSVLEITHSHSKYIYFTPWRVPEINASLSSRGAGGLDF